MMLYFLTGPPSSIYYVRKPQKNEISDWPVGSPIYPSIPPPLTRVLHPYICYISPLVLYFTHLSIAPHLPHFILTTCLLHLTPPYPGASPLPSVKPHPRLHAVTTLQSRRSTYVSITLHLSHYASLTYLLHLSMLSPLCSHTNPLTSTHTLSLIL